MRMSLWKGLLACVLPLSALALLLAACSDDDESPTTTGGTPLPTAPSQSTAWEPPRTSGGSELDCDDCIDAFCADEVDACEDDAACGAILACIQECPLFAFDLCVELCSAENPEGEALLTPALACVQDDCRMCIEGDSCEQCISQSCGAEWDACAADAECVDAFFCVVDCQEGDDPATCLQTCAAEGRGSPLLDTFFTCIQTECSFCFEEGSTTGSGPMPEPTSTPIPTGAPTQPTPESCEICLDANCSAEFDACLADEECAQQQQCVEECANESDTPFAVCLDTCVGPAPTWPALFSEAFQCAESNCPQCIPS